MFTWCKSCQRFLGQTPGQPPPRLRFDTCRSCPGGTTADHSESLMTLYENLRQRARQPGLPDLQEVIDSSPLMRVDPVDLMLGMARPILMEMGEADVPVHTIHHFCAFLSDLLARLIIPLPAEAPDQVLLLCSPGNQHDLGIRILQKALAREGINAALVRPGLPAGEFNDLIKDRRPLVLGLSVADRRAGNFVRELATNCSKLERPPTIIVGGPGIHGLTIPQEPGFLEQEEDPGRFLTRVATLCKGEPEKKVS